MSWLLPENLRDPDAGSGEQNSPTPILHTVKQAAKDIGFGLDGTLGIQVYK